MRLAGKVAIVTGAGWHQEGIAARFAAEAVRVLLRGACSEVDGERCV